MTMITFKYQGKSKELCQNDTFITEYSDNPEVLAKIISEITDLTCDLSYDKPTWDDNYHLKSDITIWYCCEKLQFDFYHSLKDTREWGINGLDSEFLKNTLYNLLSTIGLDTRVRELDFDAFCDEFGYDQDSSKAHEIYNRCCDFYSKVERVFSAEEIESFPS